MDLDWGDGHYETTARQLLEAAERAVDVAQVSLGEQVLDVGCGTGNAALAAARRGARVTAIDPSARLLEVGKQRAQAERLPIHFRRGEASRIESADRQFDKALAVFSVIFAPDPEAAAAEMLRVVRPGGCLVATSWIPQGPIHEVANIVLDELLAGTDTPLPPSRWGTPAGLRKLFTPHGVEIAVTEEKLAFEAPSPEAWFADVEANHPFWRTARAALSDRWDSLRGQSIDTLIRGNEDTAAFRTTSRYLLTRVELPAA